MLNPRVTTLAGIAVAAAATRLLPHPPNFTPIAAMALFGGAYFRDPRAAFAFPLAAMLASDLVLALIRYGMDAFVSMPLVYLSFGLTVVIGSQIRHRVSTRSIASAALFSSLLFFVITNFGVWARGLLYPRTLEGLITCYVAAIPFFRNMLLGNAFYTALLFGGFALASRRFPVLREEGPGAGIWT